MKKYDIKDLDTVIYKEVLENGLEVYFVPMENKKNYFLSYGTKYGSVHTSFIPKGEKEEIKVPDGIAHFLEHKMFEQEDGEDPFTFYAKTGTGSNASTNYNVKQYICYGNTNVYENMRYLINFVDTPYFTDENVEKEKGIIAEEIKMYDDIPEWVLEDLSNSALFKEHPIRIDVAGTVESINQITKEDLYKCYNLFYQPSNMFVVAAGAFDQDKLMEVVRETQKDHKIEKTPIKLKQYDEPKEVNELYKEIVMDVVYPKVTYGIKIAYKDFKIKDKYVFHCYIQMLCQILFGTTSLFYERIFQEELVTDFGYGISMTEEYFAIKFSAEATEYKKFVSLIEKELSHIVVTEKDIERIKRVWIASEVKTSDNVEANVSNIIDDLINYDRVVFDRVELIRSLNKDELDKIISKLNLSNHSTVVILPKEAGK